MMILANNRIYLESEIDLLAFQVLLQFTILPNRAIFDHESLQGAPAHRQGFIYLFLGSLFVLEVLTADRCLIH